MMSRHNVLRDALRSDILHLILLPTEQCNFRCTYCYERFGIGQMSCATQQAVCRLIQHRRDLKRLQISWFGGEPLVAFRVVRHIAAFAQQFCQDTGIEYQSDMTTNGYLLDTVRAQELLDLAVADFQVSLDGDREEHDRTRIQVDGRGSFDRIMENLKAMVRMDRQFSMGVGLKLTS